MVRTMLALALAGAGGAAWAQCEMQNPEPIQVGEEKGFQGTCPNTGEQVTCTLDEGDGWTCDGSEGGVSGFGDMNEFVSQACGCD